MWPPDDVDLQAVDWDELPTSQSESRQSRALTEAVSENLRSRLQDANLFVTNMGMERN